MKNTSWPLAILTILCLFGTAAFCAGGIITGTVIEDSGEPLPFANVLLLRTTDSTLVKGEVTDMAGKYAIQNVPAGDYLLLVTMVGYATSYSKPFSLNGNGAKDMGTTTIREDVAQLDAVTVTARKPLFEQKIDRLTINVATSITSAGATALQVLERSPGVQVNRQQGGITIAGKEGVVVMINGKINRMPISAVVEFLDGMPSSNIEKIELITTPPANFDAEGNAGFINIVLKQSGDQGLNGSYSLSAGYGRGESGNANINFNYRKGLFNLYGDYTYLRDGSKQFIITGRRIDFENVLTETLSRSERDPLQSNHTGRLGLDFQLNKKTVIGALLTTYDTKWTMDAENKAQFTKNGVPDALRACLGF